MAKPCMENKLFNNFLEKKIKEPRKITKKNTKRS